MRWIQHNKGKIDRGDTNAPIDGDCYYVDEKGSKAIVNGILYVDGIAAVSTQTISFQDGDIVIDVDNKGKIKTKKVDKHGK